MKELYMRTQPRLKLQDVTMTLAQLLKPNPCIGNKYVTETNL